LKIREYNRIQGKGVISVEKITKAGIMGTCRKIVSVCRFSLSVKLSSGGGVFNPTFFLPMVSSKTQEVEARIEEILASEQVELVLFEYKKQGQSWILRVFIDTPDGVSLELCEKVSRRISEYLDSEDPIEQEYKLEVSSPGIERPIVKAEHYEKFMGERIQVKLFQPVNSKKSFIGILSEFHDDELTIQDEHDNQPVVLKRELVSKATLKPILTF